ncbi:N-acyl homoserine lactonase family protein [Achromobacter arsenitoxydans]|uniref:Metallo-beta-lactamase n=1 Tax=Achromobacter arsenitoxydans SY8 TaxID=477184 RepID=H0F677_9BURK|nr:N-acyl homoserine lactonase family protein [Achromobacter arsenitoxydans]EHK66355.1 metallo-beta-lactamase [Achromobacter arsenitoxydans SY8]
MSAAMPAMPPEYEVYAIRYARMPRQRRDNFLGGDPHEGDMPMDFFVWLVRGEGRVVLVDTGFNADMARRRRRELIQCPIQALAALGVQPGDVQHVVLTHLHYDHAGNLDLLPEARFHVQDDEMDYATGRCMCFEPLRHAYAVEDVIALVRRVYEDRVVFHDGDGELLPGIELLKIGGHTKGLQALRVHTARGWVVLASDASHYYENMAQGRPFPIVYNTAQMLSGYAKLYGAAQSDQHVVPGHDPAVLERYPRWDSSPHVAMLHLPPRED